MSVGGPRNILRARTVLKRKAGLANHLASVRANDVHTENPVRLLLRDELDEALGVRVGLRARVGAEGELADVVLDALRLELVLGLANPGDLGVGVHDGGDDAVVDVAVAVLDVLDGGDAWYER